MLEVIQAAYKLETPSGGLSDELLIDARRVKRNRLQSITPPLFP